MSRRGRVVWDLHRLYCGPVLPSFAASLFAAGPSVGSPATLPSSGRCHPCVATRRTSAGAAL
eukprot:1765127-Lingulodinium_polyedra.AAC.1